jgi:hypothetical protein
MCDLWERYVWKRNQKWNSRQLTPEQILSEAA